MRAYESGLPARLAWWAMCTYWGCRGLCAMHWRGRRDVHSTHSAVHRFSLGQHRASISVLLVYTPRPGRLRGFKPRAPTCCKHPPLIIRPDPSPLGRAIALRSWEVYMHHGLLTCDGFSRRPQADTLRDCVFLRLSPGHIPSLGGRRPTETASSCDDESYGLARSAFGLRRLLYPASAVVAYSSILPIYTYLHP